MLTNNNVHNFRKIEIKIKIKIKIKRLKHIYVFVVINQVELFLQSRMASIMQNVAI